MSDRRRFNRAERAALFLVAGGRCERCGAELAPGWHADHVDPHSRGGKTDVTNGQALCGPCNLKKGNKTVTDLREWQAEALERHLRRADIALVRRLIADDTEAVDLLDRALQNPAHVHSPDVDIVHVRPDGNSRDRALRKLRTDAPELHAQVLAGKMSAHAAMVKAGFRPRTFTVRPEPKSAARTLRKYMTADQLAELARLLTQEGDI